MFVNVQVGVYSCLSLCLSVLLLAFHLFVYLCSGPAPTTGVTSEVLTDGVCWDRNFLEVCANRLQYIIHYHLTCVRLQ